MPTNTVKPWALPSLLLAFVMFYLLPLASHGLWIPDEARYAQISQEMLLSGQWAAPHLMGLRYFEKPAMGYWVIALGQAVFGHTLFGVRVASALSLGLSVVLTYLIARRLWRSPRKSLACAVIYMSFGLIIGQAGYANLDPQFTLWVNLSMVALWYALNSSIRKNTLTAWSTVGLACGLGFMTKGFLALLLPVLVALPYMLWQRRFAELLRYGCVAVLVAGLVSMPWVVTVQLREPDFWRFFFWHEHIQRFASNEAQHAEPWWFYAPLLLAASLPWALVLPSALNDAWRGRKIPEQLFLLLWLFLPLLFLSLSKGKLPPYILPCMLPLALLMGNALVNRLQNSDSVMLRSNAAFNLLIGGLGLIALIYLQIRQPIYDHEPLHLAMAIIAVAAWILANALQLSRPLRFYLAPALGMWVFIAALPSAMPDSVTVNKTPDTFIASHTQLLSRSHSLMSNDLALASALAWQTARPKVTLFDTVGEAKYGLEYPDVTGRAVQADNLQQWMAEARRQGTVGLVMRVKSADDKREMAQLPKDAIRYEQGSLVILLYPQDPPDPVTLNQITSP